PEQVERLAGSKARQSLEELQKMSELLEEAGLIRKDGDRYELTPRGIRKIGQRSLEEIFSTLKRDAFGKHRADARGRGGDPTDELKTYEFGDPFLLDLPGTVRNAVFRGGAGTPVKLHPADFDVYRTELVTQSATAILVDVSRSMLFRGCFLAAKKVTLALDSLIRSTFPKDDLYIIGFSAWATQLKPTDLPRLTWNEYVYGTNMQHAFETARTLLARSRGKNKQIILITDGEPTAHFEAGDTRPRFSYPPTKKTFEETLREVVRCTRESITINTFMLARGHYLVDFVNQMSKINNGRAFYVEPETGPSASRGVLPLAPLGQSTSKGEGRGGEADHRTKERPVEKTQCRPEETEAGAEPLETRRAEAEEVAGLESPRAESTDEAGPSAEHGRAHERRGAVARGGAAEREPRRDRDEHPRPTKHRHLLEVRDGNECDRADEKESDEPHRS